MREGDSKLNSAANSGRARFYWFLGTSIVSSLVFVLFMFTCMMVPGIPPSQKRWMFGSDATLLAGSLFIGLWRFATTDAPISQQPVGSVLGVIITLETLFCIATLIEAGSRAKF
jgi:hypothetical protein